MDTMDNSYIGLLQQRNSVESRFKELFCDLQRPHIQTQNQDNLVQQLNKQLESRTQEIQKLRELMALGSKNNSKLNDELISANIENNILSQRLEELSEEHEKLVKRWLERVQIEVQEMNRNFDR